MAHDGVHSQWIRVLAISRAGVGSSGRGFPAWKPCSWLRHAGASDARCTLLRELGCSVVGMRIWETGPISGVQRPIDLGSLEGCDV